MSAQLKVGITSIIAIFILLGGTFWIKRYNPMIQKVIVSVLFDDAKGITDGDPVTMSGVRVGEVEEVVLNEKNKALIKFSKDKRVKLYSDCVFSIRDVGLMGDKVLVIIPGIGSEELDISKIQMGTESSEFGDLINSAHDVLKKLNRIGSKLDNDLDIANLTLSFEQTFNKLNQAIEVYEEIARDNSKPLKKTISSLETSADELNRFIKNSDKRFESAVGSFQQTSEKISLAVDKIDNLSTIIDTLSAYMESGEGTLAKLIKSDELYEELSRTNASIDSFITDFRLNPGKYTKDMKFKIRLF